MFSVMGVQNIINGHGVAVSITGMLIVFSVLTFISIFIAVLPHILKLVEKVFPEKSENAPKALEPDESIVAVIASALYAKKFKG